MRLKDLSVEDLYELMKELDERRKSMDFYSRPFAYRIGIQRMRVYLDHVASGLRMIQGGDFEAHTIETIHKKRYE